MTLLPRWSRWVQVVETLCIANLLRSSQCESAALGSAMPDCFPEGNSGRWTEKRCCGAGGQADCFDGINFTFERCCPTWTGTDPQTCFGSLIREEFCCTLLDVDDECWDGIYTKRACCYSDWFKKPARPELAALAKAEKYASNAFDTFDTIRGHFFAHYLVGRNILGTCVEVGVQRAHFSRNFLKALNDLMPPDRERSDYYMVDMWKHHHDDEEYIDSANVPDEEQHGIMQEAILNVRQFWSQAIPLRLSSERASTLFGDGQLAFVYLDARHDYCAALEDMRLWWPKLHLGGVLAGDDYVHQDGWMETPRFSECRNGSVIFGSVRRAFNDFLVEVGIVNQFFAWNGQWFVEKHQSDL